MQRAPRPPVQVLCRPRPHHPPQVWPSAAVCPPLCPSSRHGDTQKPQRGCPRMPLLLLPGASIAWGWQPTLSAMCPLGWPRGLGAEVQDQAILTPGRQEPQEEQLWLLFLRGGIVVFCLHISSKTKQMGYRDMIPFFVFACAVSQGGQEVVVPSREAGIRWHLLELAPSEEKHWL